MKYIFQIKAHKGKTELQPLIIMAKNHIEAMRKFIDKKGEYPYSKVEILCLGDTSRLIK